MSFADLQRRIWEVAQLITNLPAVLPPDSCHRAEDLTALFTILAGGDTAADRAEAEDAIWAVWCDAEAPEAREQMKLAITQLSERKLTDANRTLNDLIGQWPFWAEAWNKRATLYFLQGHDARSVDDIFQTLTLEPRHFGALGGFAQICARNHAPEAALVSLTHLLRVNPHAAGVADAVSVLEESQSRGLH